MNLKPQDVLALGKDLIDVNKDGRIDRTDLTLLAKDGKSMTIILGTLASILISAVLRWLNGGDIGGFLTDISLIAIPFAILVAFKKVMDKMDSEKAQLVEMIQSKEKALQIEERNHAFDVQKLELELKQREGIESIKNFEIESLRSQLSVKNTSP